YIWKSLAGRIRSVAFSSNSQSLAAGGDDQTVRVWNISTGEVHMVLPGHTKQVESVAFHADGGLLVSGRKGETVRIWNLQTGTCLKVLENKRLYGGMRITDVEGLTTAQKAVLVRLGAVV